VVAERCVSASLPLRVGESELYLDTKGLVEGLSAALTPLIAAVTTYIAYQQWLTNKRRLAHELYERRFAIFKAVKTLYGEIGDAGTAKYGMVMRFYAATGEAEFLFGDDIRRHLEELYERGMHLASLHEKMYPSSGEAGLPVGPERSQVAEQHGALLLWFLTEAVGDSRKRFRKCLTVR